MLRNGLYIVFGYLCGSILFARVFAALLNRGDITAGSVDGNPGTANAFMNGGFFCGMLTLCGDLFKGFLPVYMYIGGRVQNLYGVGFVFVIVAPVMGHIFPIFHRFRGGKGIAVTFGCLLGLVPEIYPVLILAFVFLFFSLVIRITPHYNRTIWTYRCAVVCMIFLVGNIYIVAAFLLISIVVNINMRFSDEKKEKCQVRLLWIC